MATIILGCDTNGVHDKQFQNTVANALEKAGHTVEKLTIGPNYFASYSYSKKAKGKIGIYLIADGIFSIADLAFGNTQFKYGYIGIRGDLGRPRMKSWNDFNNNPIGRDADCTSICNKIAGKTYAQMNKMDSVKKKCQITFGATAKEMGENLVKLIGGNSTSGSGSGKSSVSSIKTCIQELLYPWNGDVFCFLLGDTMQIGRIPGPTMTRLSIIEGGNLHFESVNVTDIDPKAINKLVVNWNGKSFVLKDDERIKRFGEKKKTIKSSIKSEKNVIDFAYREWNKLLKDSGRQLECKVDGSPDWRIGAWARVYIPSFNLNGFMYITKCSHDDNGKWTTGLTLLDYPPDLGVEPSQKSSDSNGGS